ncbi:early nodulin-like protein 6 [Primulina tabacum]|uniref:early nodulin-like protein 6 n=1 Tax=Primulina tabacum TaxID=48773 RepID=UPI003F596155
MASNFTSPFPIIPIIILLSLVSAQCVELDVGGDSTGWAVPSAKNQQLYNDWASSNRFKVNDTLRFRYQKDSVLEVTQEEYEKCRSSHPIFFSNKGDTLFNLDRPGLFYFISGVSGHCERGLKMIVKVLELENVSTPPTNQSLSSPSSTAGSTPLGFAASGFIPLLVFTVLSSFTGTVFV